MSETTSPRQILLTFSEIHPDDVEVWELMQAKKAEALAQGKKFKPATTFKKLMRDWLISEAAKESLVPSALWHYRRSDGDGDGHPAQSSQAQGNNRENPDDDLVQMIANLDIDYSQ